MINRVLPVAALSSLLALGACNSQVQTDAAVAVRDVAAAAAALDAGVSTFASRDLPLVCRAAGLFVGFARDAQSAGLVPASATLAADVSFAAGAVSALCSLQPGGSRAGLVAQVSSSIRAVEGDLGGALTVLSSVASSPSAASPVALQVRRLRALRGARRPA